ncbi:MAG: hypothetical protein WA705_08565 [Candidatus Ozemobacteraceae bacterium]
MRTKSLLLLVVVIIALSASSAWAFTYRELQMANYDRDNGNFYAARDRYSRIANDYFTDREIRREACYYIGFCSVRLNDSWRAIEDFRSFLYSYDNANARFVPDALFVLARTYEVVGDRYNARNYYNDCLRRFPYGEFGEKSRERLRVIDGGYNPYPSTPNYPPSYPNLPPNPNYPPHPSYPSHPSHPGHPSHHSYSISMSVAQPTAIASSKSGRDPYEGLTIDASRIERVNGFVAAVRDMENVEEATSRLTDQDKNLEIIQKTMQDLKTKSLFQKAHGEK